ncbi:hypothetical protein M3148_17485, partial [Georgenia satyanarayanai]|nr:hypothetical protein [Georgenia satyanarayanai]
RILWDGADVTGQRVQDRGVAMVYQQFINYPGLTVYENIASPCASCVGPGPRSTPACARSPPCCA